MFGRDPRAARLLGLWTAAWLFGLLLAGILWIGDLAVQWPVLLIPVLWALLALRPRRGGRAPAEEDPQWYGDPGDVGTREQRQLPGVPPPAGRPAEE